MLLQLISVPAVDALVCQLRVASGVLAANMTNGLEAVDFNRLKRLAG